MDGDVALYFDLALYDDPVNDWAVDNPDAAAAEFNEDWLPVDFGNPDERFIRGVFSCFSCYVIIEDEDELAALECRHYFCKGCLQGRLRQYLENIWQQRCR
jgi:hypothetical protein